MSQSHDSVSRAGQKVDSTAVPAARLQCHARDCLHCKRKSDQGHAMMLGFCVFVGVCISYSCLLTQLAEHSMEALQLSSNLSPQLRVKPTKVPAYVQIHIITRLEILCCQSPETEAVRSQRLDASTIQKVCKRKEEKTQILGITLLRSIRSFQKCKKRGFRQVVKVVLGLEPTRVC